MNLVSGRGQALVKGPSRSSTRVSSEKGPELEGYTVKTEDKSVLIGREAEALLRRPIEVPFQPRVPLNIPQPTDTFQAVLVDIIRRLPGYENVQRERKKEIEAERRAFYEKRAQEQRIENEKRKLLRKILKQEFRPFINGQETEWDSLKKEYPEVNLLDSTLGSIRLPEKLTEESAIEAIKKSEESKTHILGPAQEIITASYSARIEDLRKKPPLKQITWKVHKV